MHHKASESGAFCFRRQNNFQATKTDYIQTKNRSCKCYLGNKDQKAMFLIVSSSAVLFGFGFEHPLFCVPDWTYK